MKKVLTLTLAIVMIFALCISTSAFDKTYDGTVSTNRDADATHGMSFDTFYIDEQMPNAAQAADGGACEKINDYVAANGALKVKDNTTLAFRGWWGPAADSAIASFGYSINEGEIVYGEFVQATEDAVKADGNGGSNASRFQVVVPVETIDDAVAFITCVAKLENGTVVEIITMAVNGTYTPAGGDVTPPTSDAAVVVIVAVAAVALAGVVVAKKARA